jgi:HAD superfamily hydrolase (TIGR01509 family)
MFMVQILMTPEKNYDAFFYDCDGTLADSMEPHKEAWVRVTAKHGVAIPASLIDELAGMPATTTVEEINRRYGSSLNPEAIAKEREILFYTQYMDRVKPNQFVVDHLIANYGKVKIGVVSGGRTKVVKKTLEILKVAHLIDVVICAEDVKAGKPDPEPFLKAAKKVGIPPHRCLVIEDAELGIESARRAGMDWVKV